MYFAACWAVLVAIGHEQALAKEGARNRLEFVAQGADAYQELVKVWASPDRGR